MLLHIKAIAYYFFDTCAVLFVKKKKNEGVLIVRTDAVGDFFLWTAVAGFYADLFPGKRLTFLCNKTSYGAAAAISLWEKVIPLDVVQFRKDFKYRFKMLRQIKAQGYSVAIQPTFTRDLFCGDSLVRASDANQRIGYYGEVPNQDGFLRFIFDRVFTRLVDVNQGSISEFDRNIHFAREVGSLNRPEYMPLAKQDEVIQEISLIGSYFVLCPGASSNITIWPLENYISLIKNILANFKVSIVICGSELEAVKGVEIVKQCGPRVISLCGKTSLSELVEVIRNASLLIGNDSSGVHIAASVDTPSICLLGGGQFGRFFPYPNSFPGKFPPIAVFNNMPCFNCNWICTASAYIKGGVAPCVENISVDRVLVEVKRLLLDL